MNHVIEYKDTALRGTVELGITKAYIKAPAGNMSSFWPIQKTKGKLAVTLDRYSLNSLIKEQADRDLYYGSPDYSKMPKPGDTLFMSPSCKIPRDVLRKDYKITINSQNADYIVIPDLGYTENDTDFQIAVKYKEQLILLGISDNGTFCNGGLPEEKVDEVKDAIEEWFADDPDVEFYYKDDMGRSNISFTKKIPEVKDIVLKTNPSKKYIFEKYLKYDAPSKISVETLLIWSKLDDDIRERTFASSDWRDYPFTMYNFMRKYSMNYGCVTQSFSTIRNNLENRFNHYNVDMNYVTPKDWNMLQKWTMKISGVSETGGTIRFDVFNNLTDIEKFVLLKRVAVKAFYLDESSNNNMRVGDILPE